MQKTVVFIHIDKCGGMTLRDYLASQFPAEQIRPVPCPEELVSVKPTYPITHMDLFEHHRQYRRNPHYKLVMGHYDTGILRYFDEPIVTVTVLRDPVERVVSLWKFIRREGLAHRQLAEDANQLGLDGWIRKYVGLWENAMVRQIAGVRWSSERWLAVDEVLYQQAVDRLIEIDYIGILPRLDDLLANLAEEMGWMQPEPKRLNASVRQVDVSAETRAFIEQHCRYDIDLYQVAEGIAE